MIARFRPCVGGARVLVLVVPAIAFGADLNPNTWRVFRDEKAGFSISYPKGWQLMTPRGATVKFSSSPPKGSGNCNVSVRDQPLIAGYTQDQVNQVVLGATQGLPEWSSAMGLPESAVKLTDVRKAMLGNVQAVTSKTEIAVENLQAQYTRVQYVSMLMVPGWVYIVNCGTSELDQKQARAKFEQLEPTLKTVMATFRLEPKRP